MLKDEEKRSLYDQYGEEGVEMGEQGGMPNMEDMDLSDMFGDMFGGGQRRSSKKDIPRREQIVVQLDVTLEELFTGTTKEIALERQIVCKTCDG